MSEKIKKPAESILKIVHYDKLHKVIISQQGHRLIYSRSFNADKAEETLRRDAGREVRTLLESMRCGIVTTSTPTKTTTEVYKIGDRPGIALVHGEVHEWLEELLQVFWWNVWDELDGAKANSKTRLRSTPEEMGTIRPIEVPTSEPPVNTRKVMNLDADFGNCTLDFVFNGIWLWQRFDVHPTGPGGSWEAYIDSYYTQEKVMDACHDVTCAEMKDINIAISRWLEEKQWIDCDVTRARFIGEVIANRDRTSRRADKTS